VTKQVQFRRGTTAEHSSFTGVVGEVTVDTSKDTVVVHDGSTAGGYPLVKESDLATVATTGSYSDLSGNPTAVSSFTNDSGYLTSIPDNYVLNTGDSISGNLDIVGTVTANRGIGDTETASKSGTVTPDMDTYTNFVWTLTGNITLGNPGDEATGQSGVFIFIHSGAARTVSLLSDWETAGAAGLTLSGASGAVDIVPYFVQSSGNILLGTPQLGFS